jgi:16S rRNA G966 N2-methylase RsmD
VKKDTKALIEALSAGPVREYIAEHEKHDVRDIILKHKEILGIPTTQLLDQITSRKKAKDKLPLYYNTPGIIFPPPENLEQSSSERTAEFKAEIGGSLVRSENSTLADVTGGFGVDTFFFSRKFSRVNYVEPERPLLELAHHNHQLLGALNIEYNLNSVEDFVKTTNASFDLIYIDPSRRTDTKKRIHSLQEARPNILNLAGAIFDHAENVMIKASPLLDIHAAIQQLQFVKQVIVVSVDNEVKELLFVCEKNYSGIPTIRAENLLDNNSRESFSFTFQEEREQQPQFSDPLSYLYEPNAAMLKAGAFKTIGNRFNQKKIQSSTHLYTSDEFIETFPGRKFRIEAYVKPDATTVKPFFAEGKANVTTRNYPLSPDALKKRTGLIDGGDKFLIGFSGRHKKFLVVASKL